MVCVEEMLIWFKDLNQATRIEVVCGLFEMCTPFELRFFSTVLEDYGKRDFVHVLQEAEQKLNTESEIVKLANLTDPVIRSHLLVSLILIESSNRLCATRIFNLLTEELQTEKLPLTLHSDEKYANDIGLMLTLATHHPAFSFTQQRLLSEKLAKIRDILGPSSIPSQEYDIYNNTAVWSFPTPQPSAGLDILPAVLSINPGLAVTTAYVTDWPQDLVASPSPPSTEHVRVVNPPISPLYQDDSVQRLRSPPGHNTYGQQNSFLPVVPLSELGNVETNPQNNLNIGESRPSSRPTALPCSSPAASPLSSPVSSPYVSPPASGTSSRSASPWQQHQNQSQTYNNASGSYQQASYHRSNSASVSRALRSSKSGGGVPNHCGGSSSSSTSSGYGNNGGGSGQASSRTNNNSKLQDMSTEELENKGLKKGAAGKLKKVLDNSYGNNPPNGANVYHHNHNHYHQNHKPAVPPPVTSSHGNNPVKGVNPSPPSQLPSTYNFSPSSRQRSESSPSCSEYSSPPPSPPLLEGVQGQNPQLNSQTSSSSEENLTSDQCSPTVMNDRVSKAPVTFVNSATYIAATTTTITTTSTHSYGISSTNNYASVVASPQIPSRQTNGLMPENQSPIVTTAPMMLHPFKPNSLQLNQCSSSLSNRYNLAPILFNPALMGATCNTSVPPPGLPRPAHLSTGVTLPQNGGQGQGMMPFAGPANGPPPSRNPTILRNNSNGGGSVTTVTSMHGNNHGNHRYTPPKSHAVGSNSVEKVLMPSQSQQQNNSGGHPPPVAEMMPYIFFTQPPPPVPSSAGGNVIPINCLSSVCSCSTPVSSSMGPSLSPSQMSGGVPSAPSNQGVGTPTNPGGGTPVAVTVPYHHSYMRVYPAPHALQFMTHSGCASGAGGVNNFISATLPTHFSYPLPNGMNVSTGASQNASHHELYNSPVFQLIAPPGTNGACSNSLSSAPNVQQGTLPPNAAIVPPFPGVPFPQTVKVPTCYNCGLTGHRGPDCRENTAEDSAKSNS